MIVKILLAMVVIYAAVVALAALFQSRLVYFPESAIAATPADIGLDYERVTLTTSDGVALDAWFVPAEEEGPVVLFCHGNAGNISHRLDTIRILNGLGLGVLIFDYRGYGRSQGSPSEEGTYRDAEAAWAYLTAERNVPPNGIILFGRSLGGPIAAYLATRHDPAALIVESAFTSIPDIGAAAYPYLPVRLVSRYDYPTETYVSQVTCPVLVVHSPADEMIPYEHGQAIYEAAAEPKEFLAISGSHNEGFRASEEEYSRGLADFLNGHLD